MRIEDLRDGEVQLAWAVVNLDYPGARLQGGLYLTNMRLVFMLATLPFWREPNLDIWFADIDHVERHGYSYWMTLYVTLADGRTLDFRQFNWFGLGRLTDKLTRELALTE
jgi:hypothetical protein